MSNNHFQQMPSNMFMLFLVPNWYLIMFCGYKAYFPWTKRYKNKSYTVDNKDVCFSLSLGGYSVAGVNILAV